MIRMATIGTSTITGKFIRLAQECGQINVAAVFSRNMEQAEKFAMEYGIEKCYDSLEKLAEDAAIDAVYIASPNALHYEQALQMIKAGKHILCEKALASNHCEVLTMIKAAREKQVILLEEMRTLFDPGFLAVRDNLKKLGVIRKVELEYCQYSSRYDDFKNGLERNIFRKDLSAGALMDIGVYCIHALIGFFGKPNGIQSLPVLLRNGCDGAGVLLAQYDGMIATVSYSKITNSCAPSQIQGENGTMYLSGIPDLKKAEIIYQDGRTERLEILENGDNMKYAIQYFADAISGKTEVERYQQISIDAIELMDKARNQMGLGFLADHKFLS